MPFLHSLLVGTENDLVNASGRKTCDETADEMEADGRRRGVPTRLEVSLPTGEGLLEIIMVGGCNSISRSAAASALGLSINSRSSYSSTDITVLVSVCIVESSV